jgi:hypothetical protein
MRLSGVKANALNPRGLKALDNRDGEIRTHDLSHPKRTRYQAAPRPVIGSLVSLEIKICQMDQRMFGPNLCMRGLLLRLFFLGPVGGVARV